MWKLQEIINLDNIVEKKIDMNIWRKRVTESVNWLIMRLFVEQLRLHQVC